ncbi:MAG: DUF3307 domain-containing protein [Anaerolineaceae bacterium]|nr:DUF3307 domain-containing protein [Anaerolineaceae bacterium]
MDTFNWLVIGHLVGDWLLQNDWMAQGKKRGLFTTPGLVHYTIYTIAVIVFLWLSPQDSAGLGVYLIVGGFIFFSHWIIDSTRIVEYWIQTFKQSNISIMRIMVDQTFHILVLALIAYVILVA